MGNTTSKSGSEQSTGEDTVQQFLDRMDKAIPEILTSDTGISVDDMISQDFCNTHITATMADIEKTFNPLEIAYLEQRVEKGNVVNKMKSEKINYAKKSDIAKLSEMNKTTKRRQCNGIAKFYMKLKTLYVAIVKTINPVYVYRDELSGLTIKVSPSDKKSIPSHVKYKYTEINFCTDRLQYLLNNNNYKVDDKTTSVTINPGFCNFNASKDNLLQESGIIELEDLFKDTYDYDMGKYIMSESNKQGDYKSAVKSFYNAFTGNEDESNVPSSFRSILLPQYSNKNLCKNRHKSFDPEVKGDFSNALFREYGYHLRTMYESMRDKQSKILDIIQQIFMIKTEHIDNDNDIHNREYFIVHPELTDSKLDDIVVTARELIASLYVECETNFQEGIRKYRNIVIHQNNALLQKRKNELQDTIQNLTSV